MVVLERGVLAWAAVVLFQGVLAVAAEPKPNDRSPSVLEIPGYAYDRGNAQTFADPQQYADGGPMVAFGGQSPVNIEYDVELPVDGSYRIRLRYAAADARPVDFYIDQERIGLCCRDTTGSWNTSSAQWEDSFQHYITPGKHTFRLERAGAFPHVMALRLEGSRPFPDGWNLERPSARTLDSPPPVVPGIGYDVSTVAPEKLRLAIEDLVSWPKFLHPYPLSDKHFLVSCKPSPHSAWGIYLVDTFDNFVLLKEDPAHALFEPIPLRATTPPQRVPDKVDLAKKDAIVYLPDIYVGDGLKGIPRGTVKELRLFTYHFAYQEMGGLLGVVGMDGPWDIKRVLGTVPVRSDGSAKFRIPANMPISIQPLDQDGKALQLMRSWMTAMPGEVVQCAGCHEPQNTAPTSQSTMALNEPADEIAPGYGPLRGFSYLREVQPVVDCYCVGCHDGRPAREGGAEPNLRGDVKITDWAQVTPGNGGAHADKFSVGYYELSRYVRRPGIESDYHLLEPMEFHADTTQLVQLLKKGHYGVQLDDQAWDRLVT